MSYIDTINLTRRSALHPYDFGSEFPITFTNGGTNGGLLVVFGRIMHKHGRLANLVVIKGHRKTDGHLCRNYLTTREGDCTNASLTAGRYKSRLIPEWQRVLLTRTPSGVDRPNYSKLRSKFVSKRTTKMNLFE